MRLVIPFQEVCSDDRDSIGGKAYALSVLARSGLNVPPGLCIATHAYNRHVSAAGLRERIALELSRKPFEEMRWEEMWDAALRIRSMFLNSPMPNALRRDLRSLLESTFGDTAVVVRSSAPSEDSAGTSFAGLHESYVNVKGPEAILEKIRLVWASLWSDAALLYRQEAGLDVEKSSMAVVVQEIMIGERSGVAFCRNPVDESQAVVEAVHGLNQGMVDGTVEPDRWILDRTDGAILSHAAATREQWVIPSSDGVGLSPLPKDRCARPPLAEAEVDRVFGMARQAEQIFGGPQDVEWTFRSSELYTLQSRPITQRLADGGEDKRAWYLSLRVSFDNMKALRKRIEEELIPAMDREAAELAKQDVASLSDAELADEIRRRVGTHKKWADVYWDDFIPFAHGARLFGQVYNDAVRPDDPYEFVDLLRATRMASLERNRALTEMAAYLRDRPEQAQHPNDELEAKLDRFIEQFDDLCGGAARDRSAVLKLLREMASSSALEPEPDTRDVDHLKSRFLDRFEGKERDEAEELLDLARASYRLRDDDNIHLGKVEKQKLVAADEGRRRIRSRLGDRASRVSERDVAKVLTDPDYVPDDHIEPEDVTQKQDAELRARQIVGQPAGPGIAVGRARVIEGESDLFAFQSGEILVCDAVDPNMTFVVPLAAGIVERRGGMLIHGAIIAREYGLPCVTGVPGVTQRVQTGDRITVDGHLGIVVIGRES